MDFDYVASTAWFICMVLVEVRVVNFGDSMKRSHIQVYDIKSTPLRVRFLRMHIKKRLNYFNEKNWRNKFSFIEFLPTCRQNKDSGRTMSVNAPGGSVLFLHFLIENKRQRNVFFLLSISDKL